MLCEHFNLTELPGTWPERDLNCTYDENTDTVTCADNTKFKTFSECQHSMPSIGPYDRQQCVCGDDEIVVCDSEYSAWRRIPPLECASINITSRESCIDVATNGGKGTYCNESDTPCILKYQKIGQHMMCTSQWRLEEPTVLCGDACAWTERAYNSKGTLISGHFRAIGLAISTAIIFFF